MSISNNEKKGGSTMSPRPSEPIGPIERKDLNGLIVKKPKSSKMYLIDLGKKRLISPEVFNALFERDLKIYEDLDIPFIKDGRPIPEESFMFRCQDSPKIFLVDGTEPDRVKRHIVNPAVMERYGFNWQRVQVFNVPLDGIGWPDGPPITNPPDP
jgi:hypothetical protein